MAVWLPISPPKSSTSRMDSLHHCGHTTPHTRTHAQYVRYNQLHTQSIKLWRRSVDAALTTVCPSEGAPLSSTSSSTDERVGALLGVDIVHINLYECDIRQLLRECKHNIIRMYVRHYIMYLYIHVHVADSQTGRSLGRGRIRTRPPRPVPFVYVHT